MAEIPLTVQVSIPVSLTHEVKLPEVKTLREHALETFLDHPALKDVRDLSMYVDYIGNGEMDLTESTS